MIRGDDSSAVSARASGRSKIQRRLAAVLGADIVGYSALMGRAEEQTHRRVGTEFDRLYREIEKSHGRVFTFAGDGLMAEFPSAIEALKYALHIQADAGRRNAKLPSDQWILFRIGINSGEIMLQENRTGGTAVNIAARLEALAEPGGVCLSAAVFEQVRRTVAASYEPIGEQRLKNIRDPVMVYAIRASACSSWISMPALPRLSIPETTATEAGGDYRPSLAVLPFRTLQKDQADAYFAEGMIDDIIRALGGLKDLLVISRSSTIGFARLPLDVRRVGYELDVRYVLHGSVRRAGESLRIAVELSAAQTGSVIWADRFDGDLADLFDLQDRIALRVATSIAPHLRQHELGRALRKHPDSMTAYDLTLQALDLFYRMDRASIVQARKLLEQASMHDPGYAPAYSHMASLYMRWIGQGWSEDEMADRAKAAKAARMALDRDPNDALGLAIYGHMQSYLLRAYDVAQDYLERALAAGPSCAWAWGYSSLTRGYLGDIATSIARAERAVRLSPLGADSFWLEHYLSQAYYLGGRYDDAIGWGRMSAAHAGANTSNLRCLIASLVAAGEVDEARKLAQHLLRLVPTFRLATFRARTPLPGDVRDLFSERLRRAGVPD
ncbi:MAG: adenylate/guanylate cyclase domain-containing protein [Rhodopila sp.]|nr:adenylate/guanylate cyclase domain-containing protein [Rhodopila sp.]